MCSDNLSTTRQRISLVVAALAVVSILGAGILAQSPQRGSVDWVFVIDTSASMRGAGGTKDIFDRVKRAVSDFIRSSRTGDSVTIYTYDSDTVLRPTVRIDDDTDKRDLLRIIEELKADGKRTHTGKAIRDALERANELSQRSDAANRTASIVLMTDGLEDVRGISNPVNIPSTVELIPKNQPYIFFVSLGETEHEKQLEEFVRNLALGGRGSVVRDPGATNIHELNDRIRKQIAEPPKPVEIKLSIEPASIDFGQIEPGERTGSRSLKVGSNVATRVNLALEGGESVGVRLAEPAQAIDLSAGETSVDVRLAADSDAPDGIHALRLILVTESNNKPSPEETTAARAYATTSLNVARVPLWRKLLKWLALILLVLLVAIAAYSFYKGETPWELWRSRREAKWLEGELELLRPSSPQYEDGFIGLGRLGRDRAALSSLLPTGATAESDAELIAVRKSGSKLIQIHRTLGSVRVNQVEVVIADLYDGDIVELGDARLRFNWTGHERPVDADENF